MKANYGTFKSLTCLKTTYHCDGCTFIKLKFIVVISTCIKIRIKTKSDFEETPSPYMYEGSSFNSAAAVTFPTGGNIDSKYNMATCRVCLYSSQAVWPIWVKLATFVKRKLVVEKVKKRNPIKMVDNLFKWIDSNLLSNFCDILLKTVLYNNK